MKEVNTKLLLLTFGVSIILGGFIVQLGLRNVDLSEENQALKLENARWKSKDSALKRKYITSTQANLIIRSYVRGRAERNLLKDRRYKELVKTY